MLEDSPLTYEQAITWLNNKISNGDPSRHPYIRRLVVIRKNLIESRKTDMGIKMFIKQHRIL